MTEEEYKQQRVLKDALEKIRHAGNNLDECALWMQRVAAHALNPQQWPDPGPHPTQQFPDLIDVEQVNEQLQANAELIAQDKSPQAITFPLSITQRSWIQPHLDYCAKEATLQRKGMLLALVAQVGFPVEQVRIGVKFISHELAQTLTAK